MRKIILVMLILLLALLAAQATAETYVLDEIRGAIEIPDSYIMLTPANLAANAGWLESRGLSEESVRVDFEKRGVLMQCWTEEQDACFELTALRTEQSLNIFDINEQDTALRGSYRLGHYPENLYSNQGYDFSSADWKNTANGRFLILRYIKRDGSEIAHRGLMRRTIRNGYEISFDMQVFGRSLTNKDNAALNKIWNSFSFVEVMPLPPSASAKINITKAPPVETNSADIVIEGTAAKGVRLIAVTMGMTYSDPLLTEVEVGASGKFKLPIKLPKEGVFVITITGEYGGEDVAELVYSVTYQHTLLTINVTTPVEGVVTTKEVTILGTAEPGASIQVFVNSEAMGTKKVTGAGKFKIDIKTAQEGAYEVVLAFSKKGLADRRLTFSFTREWSEADMLKELKSQSIKPGYATLIKNMEGYEGRIMGYQCYMVGGSQSGDEWIARMALTKRSGEYRSVILVLCKEQPSIAVGEQVTMYGTCVGMSLPEEGDETGASYPCFELLAFVQKD